MDENNTRTLLKILKWPDDQLHIPCMDVTVFGTDQLRELCLDMFYTMKESNGIGLAAPQVGKLINLLVVWLPIEEHVPIAIFNPELISASEQLMKFSEGCLSVPGYFEDRERPSSIVIKFKDVLGEAHEAEFTGLYAFCIQHEMDHLKGKVFVDGASMLKKQFIKRKIKKSTEGK